MSQLPPPITEGQFVDLDTTNEEDIKRRFSPHVKSLHSHLNQLPCLQDLQKVRRRWKARSSSADAFGTFATDPRHWYSFHHGGRNEAQFNVGMFTTHFRVGLGFEFSEKKGGDPTIVHLAYACFVNIIRTNQQVFNRFVIDNNLEVEWVEADDLPLHFVASADVVSWLLDRQRLQRMPMWIFVGRLLRRGQESTILENADALGSVIQSVFCHLKPTWEQAQMLASTA